MNFSNTLRTLIEDRHLTQKEIASSVGIAQNTLSSYINGKRQPDLQMLCLLAEYFNVSTDYLLGYIPSTSALSAEQLQLIEISKKLSETRMKKLVQIAKILSE